MLLIGGHQEPITSIKTIECDEFKHTYIPSATKLQRLCFLQACVCPHGGVCLGAWWDTTPLWEKTPPGADTHPPEQTHTPGADTPQNRHPLEQTPPRDRHTSLGETTTAADGTHPTGMHSCLSTCLNHALSKDSSLAIIDKHGVPIRRCQ